MIATAEKLAPPTAPGQWALADIINALSRPLPASVLKTKRLGGQEISYISWHSAAKILDKYAIGWAWEVRSLTVAGELLVLVGRLTIPTADGPVYREATGTELLATTSYGDAASNAESSSFRRAAAKFGLGLYLYSKGVG